MESRCGIDSCGGVYSIAFSFDKTHEAIICRTQAITVQIVTHWEVWKGVNTERQGSWGKSKILKHDTQRFNSSKGWRNRIEKVTIIQEIPQLELKKQSQEETVSCF